MSIVVTDVTPAQQLERVKQLNQERRWGFAAADFPEVPQNPTLNEGEALLLAVYLPPQRGRQSGLRRTFEELWSLVEPPSGYDKSRWDELKSDSKHLRSVPGYDYKPGIRWLVFNPNAYHGLSPQDALARAKADGLRLAGLEVLMALVLFPDWANRWDGTTVPYPWLSGLQFNWDNTSSAWSLVPDLYRWVTSRQLLLSTGWSGLTDSYWGSPSVREY